METPTPVHSSRLQRTTKRPPLTFLNNNLPKKYNDQPTPEPRVFKTYESEYNTNQKTLNKSPPTLSVSPTLSPTSNPIPVTLPRVKPSKVHLPLTEAQYITIYKDTFVKKVLSRLKQKQLPVERMYTKNQHRSHGVPTR